jgi:CheY-like chemotaxis protein
VARAILADPELAGTPIVAITGANTRPRDADLRAVGVTSLIRKPILPEQLHLELLRALGLASPEPAPPVHQPIPVTSEPEPAFERNGAGALRVLVVDDNAVNQRVAARMLTRAGCRVDGAAAGHEAVELVSQLPYDLVLMDCMMPGMDGYEATASIRQLRGPAARIPIVAMTANAMRGDRERCLAAGMDEYLTKPLRAEELRAVLERWTGPGRSAAPASDQAPSPVDLAVLESFRELQEPGAADVVSEFIDLFLDDLPGRLAAIRDAAAARDPEPARAAAHALKGSSGYIGALRLSRKCRELELAAKERNLELLLRQAEEVEREASDVDEFLRQHRAVLAAREAGS